MRLIATERRRAITDGNVTLSVLVAVTLVLVMAYVLGNHKRRPATADVEEGHLNQLARAIGGELSSQGICDEDQLDVDIDASKREAFAERYGAIGHRAS